MKILVVEDNPKMARSVEMTLTESGFEVVTVGTVAEAKAKGGGGSCQPDPSCIAAFLAAAEPFTYMHCSAPPHL